MSNSKIVYQHLSRRAYEHALAMKKRFVSLFTAPSLVLLAQPAWAMKASDLTSGIKTEWAQMVQLGLFIVAGLGILFAAAGAISWVVAKKNNEPAKWQGYAMLGGAVAIVVPVFILALSGSLTNEQGNAEEIMNDMGVNF